MVRCLLASLALVLWVSFVQAAAPKIETVSPSLLFVQEINTTRVLGVTGQNLLGPGTSANDVDQRVKVFFQIGSAKQQVWMSGWAATTLTVNFGSLQWLSAPGTLNVTVETDGVVSNTISVPIQPQPTAAPQIQSVSPEKFIIGQESGAHPYAFRIWAANLSDWYHTGVTVDGKVSQIALVDPASGVVDAMLPKEFQGVAGKHSVTVSTSAGGISAAATIEVRAAPVDANIIRVKDAGRLVSAPKTPIEKAAELSVSPAALRCVDANIVNSVLPVGGAVVTLTGKTTSADKRKQIEDAARAIPGVTWVDNQITVDPNQGPTAAPFVRKKN